MESFTLRGYSRRTLQCYAYQLKPFLSYISQENIEQLSNVTKHCLEQFRIKLTGRALGMHTVHAMLMQVRSFFDFLEKEHLIFTNPATGIVLPVCERRLQPITSEHEVQLLLSQPDTWTASGMRDKAFMEVAYSTAARLEELVTMDLASLDMGHKIARVLGKGSKERMLPLGKQAMFWLEKYLHDSRPALTGEIVDNQALWIGSHGKRLHRRTIQTLFRHYSGKADIKPGITPHGLRRACATHMLRRGAHPVQIQMLLGHATLGTLNKYLKVTITDMQKSFDNTNPAA